MQRAQNAQTSVPVITNMRSLVPPLGCEVLKGAERVVTSLRSGTPQTEVARRAEGPLPYGIGLMLFRLVEKKLLDDEALAFRSLRAEIGRARSGMSAAGTVSRRTVIANLRKNQLIDPSLSVRAIKPSGSTPNIHQVIRITEESTKISAEEILSRNRSRPIVNARFCAMWALRAVSGTSFSVIGEHFGGKDHTTVINAVNQVDLKRLTDNAFRKSTDQIVDDADLIGVRSSLEMLRRNCALRAV
jgi:hypothetical protein